MNDLGVMYASGAGLAKDETEAVRWYRAAANGGNAVAMDNSWKHVQEGSRCWQR